MTPGAKRPRPDRGGAVLAGLLFLSSVFALLAACRRKRPRSFGQVVSELQRTAKEGNCARLFRLLDQKTRWAAISLVRDARRIVALIRAHYPPDQQPRALARVQAAALAPDARRWVERFCTEEKVFEQMRDLLGKPRQTKVSEGEGRFVTGTGRKVRCSVDPYGRWGCDVLRDRLEALQVRMANLLKVTEENAAFYRKGGR